MPTAGTFSGGGLGMGVAFTLKDQFSQTADKIKKQQQMLSGSTDAMTKKVNASLNMMFSGAKMMAAGGALAAPFIIGINKSQEFNKEMSKVFAISRIEDEQTKQALTKTALELGTATKFTATQAAEGMSFLAMAGFTANQQIEAMPGLLSLAAAGNTDLALTADIVSDSMTAMGLEAKQTTMLADQMAATITRSNTDITQMGEALKYSTAQANSMNVSTAELNAMIGMLGDIGLKGSVAGTGINQMLLGMNGLAQSAEKMKALGIVKEDLMDVNGNLKPMTDILPLISNQFKKFGNDFGNVAQSGLLQDVFQIRGAKAFSAFLKVKGKDFKDFVNTIEGGEGAAAKISEQMLDNFAGDMTKLSSIVDTTLINLGSSVENGLRPAAKGLTVIVELFNAFISSPVGKYVMQFTAALSGLLLVMGLLKIVTGGLQYAVIKLIPSLWAATLPLLPFIAIGVAVIGAILGIKKAMEAFGSTSDTQMEKVKGLQKIFLKLGGIFTGIKEIFQSVGTDGFTLSVDTENKLEKLGVLGTVQKIGRAILQARAFWTGFTGALTGFGTSIKNAVEPLFSAIGEIINLFANTRSEVTKGSTNLDKFAKNGEVLGILFKWSLQPVIWLIKGISLGLKALIPIVDFVIKLFTVFYQAGTRLFKVFSLVLGKVKSVIVSIFEFVATAPAKFFALGSNIVTNIKDGIISVWDSFTSWFSDKLNSLTNGVKNFFGYGKDENAGNVSMANKNGTASTTNKVIDKTANANKPLVLRSTSEVTREVGDMSFNIMVDGTPLSSQFVKTQTRNTRRSE